ncbi:nuclear transport factor 2 family protein [Glycomyces albidus]|uniref:Nuclear transport factor 2 family protein n=1 Tax=Glycomyces albidus TaxID=2656774 RepID=A0A6L5G328_9ACTN|nr:nuclear transport factor 2 family protein [Glycomyces albidus]MQM24267.1 nuclear transport factor 2 family protein [Glycomyces albidus]
MTPLHRSDPKRFIAGFFTDFNDQVVHVDGDPGPAMDRFYTRDIVQYADGIRLDYDRLLAHIRPVRKNLVEGRFEVHEAIADGDRIAARFTVHALMRQGPVTTEVYFFGRFAADGRLAEAHQSTRAVKES